MSENSVMYLLKKAELRPTCLLERIWLGDSWDVLQKWVPVGTAEDDIQTAPGEWREIPMSTPPKRAA